MLIFVEFRTGDIIRKQSTTDKNRRLSTDEVAAKLFESAKLVNLRRNKLRERKYRCRYVVANYSTAAFLEYQNDSSLDPQGRKCLICCDKF
jgi:hypothetical protein